MNSKFFLLSQIAGIKISGPGRRDIHSTSLSWKARSIWIRLNKISYLVSHAIKSIIKTFLNKFQAIYFPKYLKCKAHLYRLYIKLLNIIFVNFYEKSLSLTMKWIEYFCADKLIEIVVEVTEQPAPACSNRQLAHPIIEPPIE